MTLNRCPSIDVYRRMIENQLSPGEFAPLESHLEHCAACQLQLDCLTAFADTAWMTPPPRKSRSTVPQIAGIVVQGEVGRGGYGVVYRGYQTALARSVAVKVPRNGAVSTDLERSRFSEEAKAAAQLRHPNIAQMYAVDSDSSGNPYMLLEYVAGISLAKRLSEGPLPVSDAVKLVYTIASAVGHAHGQNVIHRDLKPGNVLLADGTLDRPVVTDFGLAKRLDAPAGLTHTVESLGTPTYMSPELAAGGARVAGPSADVYSLGVILYECLTGHPPFRGATSFETLLLARDCEPVPLRKIIPTIDRDIETVCSKCLEKSPADRYPTACALAEDLKRVQEHRPIQARPATLTRRLQKWRRRHPMRAAGVGVSLLAMLVIGIAITWHGNRLSEERARVRAEELVSGLLTAETGKVPSRIQELEPYRHWTDPLLAAVAMTAPEDSRERLHVALALVTRDPAQVAYLTARLLDATPPEVGVIVDAIVDSRHARMDRWWAVATDFNAHPGDRIRAACVLAKADAGNPRTTSLATFLAAYLATENPLHLSHWLSRLKPLMPLLVPEMSRLLVDPKREEVERQQIASVLVATKSKLDPTILCDSEPRIFRMMFSSFNSGDEANMASLRQIANRVPIPGMPESERVALASRASRAAIALARLGEYEPLWSLLAHSPNPTTRSYLIELLGPCGLDPHILAAKLQGKTPKSVCRAIVLALGHYEPGEVPTQLQEALSERLLSSYKMDPDAGYHSAIDWLLRQRWRRGTDLDRLNTEFVGKPPAGKRWWVNKQGQTFAVLKGPHRVTVGSPKDELHRYTLLEAQREVLIPRTFAIATREVTVEEYRKFDPTIDRDPLRRLPPHAHCPIYVSPVAAMRYCNWLSEQDNIPASDRAYPNTISNGSNVVLQKDFLSGPGYRLPTSAEWELACRSDTTTARYFGEGTQSMKSYAWTLANSDEHPHPVGEKLPNELGLFDMLGNVWEATHPTRYTEENAVDTGFVNDWTLQGSEAFFARGGSYLYLASFARAAKIYPRNPYDHDQTVGFRIAKTIQVHVEGDLPPRK